MLNLSGNDDFRALIMMIEDIQNKDEYAKFKFDQKYINLRILREEFWPKII